MPDSVPMHVNEILKLVCFLDSEMVYTVPIYVSKIQINSNIQNKCNSFEILFCMAASDDDE